MPSLFSWKQVHKSLKCAYNINNNTLKGAYFNKYSSTNSKNKDNQTSDNSKKVISEEKNAPLEPPEEPTTCCMSGCANCVWLDYAEALCKYFQDGGEQAIKEINERISDPNIKAYILHEVRMRNKK